MKSTFFVLLVSCIIFSCQPPKEEKASGADAAVVTDTEPEVDLSKYPEVLQKALKTHGDLQNWRDYARLEYTAIWPEKGQTERQIINLNNRKILIDRDSMQIGYDGEVVWVAPNLESFEGKSARFYHNLYFYFFGMPFLLADPGINYEDLGERTVDGKTYHALQVSYQDGVGDTPEDLYIAHFDTESYQLELLLYTVTYFSGEKHTDYNALLYSEWTSKDGLLVPTSLKGHKFEDGKIGEMRYEVAFTNIIFSEVAPEEHIFERPEFSEVDSLKKYTQN